jgi:hypothetical protein
MNRTPEKIISDVSAGQDVVSVKSPFKLHKDGKRRFIRIELSEPVTFTLLRDSNGIIYSEMKRPVYSGSILNVSAGGILVSGNDPVEEGSILLLKMSLQGIEVLDNIIGIVKRAEFADKDWLIGIEFVPREQLPDLFSAGEIEILPANAASFDERIKMVLNKYAFRKRISIENRTGNE